MILHEDELDWKEISNESNDYLSLIEARLFGDRIFWRDYIETHPRTLTEPFLEVASKYFTENEYFALIVYDCCLSYDTFIRNHAKEFAKFAVIFIGTTRCNEETCEEVIKNIDEQQFNQTLDLLIRSAEMNTHISDNQDEYATMLLYLKSHL